MNLLLALVIVVCGSIAGIAYAVPDEVWHAVAERIRNPRPSTLETLHRRWEAEDRIGSVKVPTPDGKRNRQQKR